MRRDEQDTGFGVAFREPAFRAVFAAGMLSGSGQWTLVYARGWLLQRLTGSSTWVGAAVFASWVPYLFATPLGGLLADRFPRKRLSTAMYAVSLASSALLAVLTIAGVIEPWQVLVLALIAGAARAAEVPSTTAIIPNTVPQKYLLNAISLNSAATFGSQLLGPALALGLLARGLIGEVFLMTTAFYALAIVLMLGVKAPQQAVRAATSLWHETSDTWKYVAAAAMVPTIIVLGGLHCGLTMTKDAILPSFTKDMLHGGGSMYSLLGIGFGAGTMAGTFALSGLRTEEAKGPLYVITGVVSGLTVVALAFSTSPLPAFLVLALMGASQGMFIALGNTLIQQVVPDELRGRVSGAYLMVSGGAMSFGNFGAGALADRYSMNVVLIAPSLLFVAVVVAMTALRPGMRLLYRTGVLPGGEAAVAHPVTV